MHSYPRVVVRPGVHHTLVQTAPHSPQQQIWFEETCRQVEALIQATRAPRRFWLYLSTGVHVVADYLFLHHGADAAWAKLDPEHFIAWYAEVTFAPDPIIPGTVTLLYAALTRSGQVERDTGTHITEVLRRWSDAPTAACANRAGRRAAAAAARRRPN